MYKVEILNGRNVIKGARYCLTRKSAINLVAGCTKWGFDFSVSKFIRLGGPVFAWSETELTFDDKFWDEVDKIVRKEREVK